MERTTRHTGCDRLQVLYQQRPLLKCTCGGKRLDQGLQIGRNPGPWAGYGEVSPEKPLHRTSILKRLDTDLPARRTTVKIDPGAVDLKPRRLRRLGHRRQTGPRVDDRQSQ